MGAMNTKKVAGRFGVSGRSVGIGVGVVGALLALSAMQGCELLVSFDRSKIPEDGGATTEDGTTADGGQQPDTSMTETAADAGPDVTTPTGGDAADGGMDALPDQTVADGPGPDSPGTTDAPSDSPAHPPLDSPAHSPPPPHPPPDSPPPS